MDCKLVSEASSTQQYQNQLRLYTSAGLLPKMEIHNRTNSAAFTFTLSIVSLNHTNVVELLSLGCAMYDTHLFYTVVYAPCKLLCHSL